jgi:hypothetical protein
MNKRDIKVGDRFDWESGNPGDNCTITKIQGDKAWFLCDDGYSSDCNLDQIVKWKPMGRSNTSTKDYYNGTEVFDQMILLYGLEAVKGFCICNAYKYRQRAGKKSDAIEEDIKKALWYETKLKEIS